MAAKSHDDYLASRPEDQCAALQHLREVIAAAAPEAEEVFAYGVPAFRQGKVLVCYAGMSKHCGFYLYSGDLLAHFADELSDYSIDKGTVRFMPDHPIPDELIARIVAARIEEVTA